MAAKTPKRARRRAHAAAPAGRTAEHGGARGAPNADAVAPRTPPPRPDRRLTSARLSGRPARADDWPLIHALQTDPDAGPWLRGPRIAASEARSRAIAAAFAEAWAAEGCGPYVWSLNGREIGYAGLRPSRLGAAEWEALWAFLPRAWSRGYATEAAAAAIAADGAGLALVSWTLPDNLASRRVMEKLGFRYDGEATWAELAHVLYRRPAERPTWPETAA